MKSKLEVLKKDAISGFKVETIIVSLTYGLILFSIDVEWIIWASLTLMSLSQLYWITKLIRRRMTLSKN